MFNLSPKVGGVSSMMSSRRIGTQYKRSVESSYVIMYCVENPNGYMAMLFEILVIRFHNARHPNVKDSTLNFKLYWDSLEIIKLVVQTTRAVCDVEECH